MKRKHKYLTKKRIAELNEVGGRHGDTGNYMAWVTLRNQYSDKALVKHGILKVADKKAMKKA